MIDDCLVFQLRDRDQRIAELERHEKILSSRLRTLESQLPVSNGSDLLGVDKQTSLFDHYLKDNKG